MRITDEFGVTPRARKSLSGWKGGGHRMPERGPSSWMRWWRTLLRAQGGGVRISGEGKEPFRLPQMIVAPLSDRLGHEGPCCIVRLGVTQKATVAQTGRGGKEEGSVGAYWVEEPAGQLPVYLSITHGMESLRNRAMDAHRSTGGRKCSRVQRKSIGRFY